MYLMYVDESGDPGITNSPTRYFALSGLVVHEANWHSFMQQLMSFRRTMKTLHGLPARTEIHAAEFLKRPPVPGMPPHIRLAILRSFIEELSSISSISITNVLIDKSTKGTSYDVFENAWKILFQRFENTMRAGNFPGGYTDKGMIFVDNTNGKKLRAITRRMSVYNPIPSSYGPGYLQAPTVHIVEEPHGKDSANSLCIQAVDVAAYFLHKRYSPNRYLKNKGAHKYFDRLVPVLNTRASRFHALGIVEL